jgi:hypothetical protein
VSGYLKRLSLLHPSNVLEILAVPVDVMIDASAHSLPSSSRLNLIVIWIGAEKESPSLQIRYICSVEYWMPFQGSPEVWIAFVNCVLAAFCGVLLR